MELVDVWVPIIGAGTDDDPWRADVPRNEEGDSLIPYTSREGVPHGLDPDLPNFGRPVAGHMLISVRPQDVGKIKQALPASQVPQEHRLLVELCRAVERKRGTPGHLTPASEARVRAIFERERSGDKVMLGRLIVRMARRGLSVQAAQAIADELGMT